MIQQIYLFIKMTRVLQPGNTARNEDTHSEKYIFRIVSNETEYDRTNNLQLKKNSVLIYNKNKIVS